MADIGGKPKVLSYGKEIGNVSLCRHFGIFRQTYYPAWKREDYEREGERALINSKPCPKNPKIRVAIDQNKDHVREFGVYTKDHQQIIEHLHTHGITTIAKAHVLCSSSNCQCRCV